MASLNKEASVFLAEIFSIKQSVEDLLKQEKTSKKVMITTDSQSTVTALINPLITSDEVKKCKETINLREENKEIFIEWCRGHNDIAGNELADYLAKSRTVSVLVYLPVILRKHLMTYFTKCGVVVLKTIRA
uniref:Putative LOC101744750 [Bombyx mori] n=1 Tax=Lepeophtheirus salmonis TaxID=72036 RepID=A0A0K2VC18_LEPSM